MRRHARLGPILLGAAWLAAACAAAPIASAQAAVRAPMSVRDALDIMSRVVADSEQMIASRRYDQLPRETREFEAGLTALEQGVGTQPSQLRSRLEPLIAKARVASSAMSEAAQSNRDSMLPLTHRQLADAVNAIIAAFPEDLRPGAAQPRNIR
jgi:hypothetical protein